jgi:hypothetical protein
MYYRTVWRQYLYRYPHNSVAFFLTPVEASATIFNSDMIPWCFCFLYPLFFSQSADRIFIDSVTTGDKEIVEMLLQHKANVHEGIDDVSMRSIYVFVLCTPCSQWDFCMRPPLLLPLTLTLILFLPFAFSILATDAYSRKKRPSWDYFDVDRFRRRR